MQEKKLTTEQKKNATFYRCAKTQLEELEKLPVITGQYSFIDVIDGLADLHDDTYGEFVPTVRYVEVAPKEATNE